jgi:hypothetical protein
MKTFITCPEHRHTHTHTYIQTYMYPTVCNLKPRSSSFSCLSSFGSDSRSSLGALLPSMYRALIYLCVRPAPLILLARGEPAHRVSYGLFAPKPGCCTQSSSVTLSTSTLALLLFFPSFNMLNLFLTLPRPPPPPSVLPAFPTLPSRLMLWL